ncbi:sigma-70 family RNA polymerase sigma factor [Bacillus mesophilum]|uniref:Sigma-70 family RNA polymerase sigma factor n=1 Tax=Bacillus mesophilum TaxID=1071718 RepID=A0A7V7RLJ6_9BACI|nr:sigma-70 family RNA polymerase sigma factor [Bacillus mesophilum]KAB2331766.1 sigma-70 family RNA polymerase sigma factor [Bacillus mesophilum]
MEKSEKDKLLITAMDDYGHYLVRLAYVFVKDETKAEDIVQEVFLRYYLKLEVFEGRSSVKTYLYRMTVNECRNYFKSWSYRKLEFSNWAGSLLIHQNTPESQYVKLEEEKALASLLDRLPLKYKEVIWLHYYAEFSIAEIAGILNCSINTVKTRLARGRKKAKLALTEEEFKHDEEY